MPINSSDFLLTWIRGTHASLWVLEFGHSPLSFRIRILWVFFFFFEWLETRFSLSIKCGGGECKGWTRRGAKRSFKDTMVAVVAVEKSAAKWGNGNS